MKEPSEQTLWSVVVGLTLFLVLLVGTGYWLWHKQLSLSVASVDLVPVAPTTEVHPTGLDQVNNLPLVVARDNKGQAAGVGYSYTTGSDDFLDFISELKGISINQKGDFVLTLVLSESEEPIKHEVLLLPFFGQEYDLRLYSGTEMFPFTTELIKPVLAVGQIEEWLKGNIEKVVKISFPLKAGENYKSIDIECNNSLKEVMSSSGANIKCVPQAVALVVYESL